MLIRLATALVVVVLAAACSSGTPAASHAPGPATASGGGTSAVGSTGSTRSTSSGGSKSSTGSAAAGRKVPGSSTTSSTAAPKVRPTGPVVAKVRPSRARAGAVVVLIGKRLATTMTVSFHGIPASVTVTGAYRVKVVVPSGATSGPITVVTRYGSATLSGFVVP